MNRFLIILILTLMSFSTLAKELSIEFDGKKISLIIPKKEKGNKVDEEKIRQEISNQKFDLYKEYEYLYFTNIELKSRIYDLEYAVRHLQETVYHLQNQEHIEEIRYECMMTTKRHGTFTGSAKTKLKAKANTLEACEKKLGSNYYCKNEVLCEAVE